MYYKRSRKPIKLYRFKKSKTNKPSQHLVSLINKVVKKRSPVHHAVFDRIGQVMTQETIYTSSLLTELVQGVTEAQFIGQEVDIAGFNIKLQMINTSAITNNVNFRFMLVESPIEILSGSAGAWGAGLTAQQMFLNYGTLNPVDGLVNLKKINVIYDKVFTVTLMYLANCFHVM